MARADIRSNVGRGDQRVPLANLCDVHFCCPWCRIFPRLGRSRLCTTIRQFQKSDVLFASFARSNVRSSVASSRYTLFVVATGDGWSADVTLPCAANGAAPIAYPFFITFNVITSFVLINMVVGFLLEKMVVDKTTELPYIVEKERARVKQQEHRKRGKKSNSAEGEKETASMTRCTCVKCAYCCKHAHSAHEPGVARAAQADAQSSALEAMVRQLSIDQQKLASNVERLVDQHSNPALVYAGLYTCPYTCRCTCLYKCLYTCRARVSVFVPPHASLHMCVRVPTRMLYRYLHTCVCTCLYTWLCTCLYMCLRTCLYTCLHTFLYTGIQAFLGGSCAHGATSS